MAAPDPKDEYRHVPDSEPLWNESYYLDFFNEDLSLGGYVRIGFLPNLNRVWYWACLVGADRRLVTVIDHEVPLPRSDLSLDIRHDSLWADHTIEDPLKHMSINLESFAVQLDDPADTYGDMRGEVIPFGFELDYFTDRAAYLWPPVTPRYEIPCRVHGQISIGTETIPFDGWGQRDHSWGSARDWWAMAWTWSAGRLDDGTRWHCSGGFTGAGDFGVGYILDADSPAEGAEFREFYEIPVSCTDGREGLFEASTHTIGDLAVDFTPVAFSPVLLEHDDGRQSRFPRALAKVRTNDGRTGAGWIEWNQPPI
ncbi:MAG: hypothetical protein KDB26_10855 [Microthrixaceae bacterium]|nr:hypothetical protein [Microthrixaceae bacterium]